MADDILPRPARALIDDALQRLGKARLSLGLARELLTKGSAELTTASERIAAAAADLRTLTSPVDLSVPTLAIELAREGMAWWDSLSERERAEALKAGGTDVPAEAYAHYRRSRGLA